jgi:hypothetical protein
VEPGARRLPERPAHRQVAGAAHQAVDTPPRHGVGGGPVSPDEPQDASLGGCLATGCGCVVGFVVTLILIVAVGAVVGWIFS